MRQSFSHGRTKAVVVEKVKRRTVGAEPAAKVEAPVSVPKTVQKSKTAATTPSGRASRAKAPETGAPAAGAGAAQAGVVLRTLTEEERDARARALVDAREREVEDRKRAEIEAKDRAERDAKEKAERDAAAARKAEEESRRSHDAEAKRKAEDTAAKRLGTPPGEPVTDIAPSEAVAKAPDAGKSATMKAPAAAKARADMESDEGDAKRIIRRPGMPTKVVQAPRGAPRGGVPKQRGRLTVSSATSGEEERTRSVASFRRRMQRLKGGGAEPKEKLLREVILPETITIQELANRMSERAVDVIRLLMKQGVMHKITDVIDADTAQLIAEELGHTVKRVAESTLKKACSI